MSSSTYNLTYLAYLLKKAIEQGLLILNNHLFGFYSLFPKKLDYFKFLFEVLLNYFKLLDHEWGQNNPEVSKFLTLKDKLDILKCYLTAYSSRHVKLFFFFFSNL